MWRSDAEPVIPFGKNRIPEAMNALNIVNTVLRLLSVPRSSSSPNVFLLRKSCEYCYIYICINHKIITSIIRDWGKEVGGRHSSTAPTMHDPLHVAACFRSVSLVFRTLVF